MKHRTGKRTHASQCPAGRLRFLTELSEERNTRDGLVVAKRSSSRKARSRRRYGHKLPWKGSARGSWDGVGVGWPADRDKTKPRRRIGCVTRRAPAALPFLFERRAVAVVVLPPSHPLLSRFHPGSCALYHGARSNCSCGCRLTIHHQTRRPPPGLLSRFCPLARKTQDFF